MLGFINFKFLILYFIMNFMLFIGDIVECEDKEVKKLVEFFDEFFMFMLMGFFKYR